MRDALIDWTRRHRRALLRAGAGVVAVYALYLLAANVFLNTQIGAATINRKPARFTAQWDWAMSLYPGHIHASGVRLRGRVRTVQWTVTGSVADGRIKLLPLLRKRLHFGDIDGGTVRMDVETGLPMMAPTPRTGAAARRRPWELVFDGIHTGDLRRGRLGEWVVEGQGEAVFAFYKQIGGGPMQIPRSEFRMRRATLRQGDAVWAREAEFALELAIARHVPSKVPGLRKLRLTDARLQLSGAAPGLVLEEAKDGRLALRRAGAGGRITADLSLERSALKPGGRLDARMPLTLDGAKDARQQHMVRARLDVRRDATALRVRVPPAVEGGNHLLAELQVPGRELQPRDMRALLADAQGRVRMQWRFGSLAWLNPLLSRGWLRLDGAADVRADLRIVDGRIVDGSTASIPRASLQSDVQDNRITGDVRAEARVQGGRALVDMDADRFVIAPLGAAAQPYVRGNDLRLRLASSSDLARFRDEVQTQLAFTGARIPDLRAYNRMLPAGSVRLLGGSGSLSGDLALDPQGRPLRAKITLTGTRASMQVGASRLTGDLRLDSALHRVSGSDYLLDRLQMDLSGVRLAGASGDGPWWARASLDGARFGWQVPLRLRGDARLRMQDVGILLSLFAQRSAFPAWVGKLIDEGQVQATSGVRVDGSSVVLDELRARNERIDLRARLRLAGDAPTGHLYARWGVLGVGAQLQQGRSSMKLVGARRWYESRPALPR